MAEADRRAPDGDGCEQLTLPDELRIRCDRLADRARADRRADQLRLPWRSDIDG